MGKIGRRAVELVLPELKREYQPDLIVANAENIAHGKGVTPKTLQQLQEAGVEFFTSGNHIFDKSEGVEILQDKDVPLIRPANYPPGVPGVGAKIVQVGTQSILMINLLGQVFIDNTYDCPFRKVRDILEEYKDENLAGVIVDFHAEASSEKQAMGWHLDGLASAVFCTHNHVCTIDARVLSKGTAYVTDVGMVGARDSVIGVDKETILKRFLTKMPVVHEHPEEGECVFNAVLVEIDSKTRLATKIERVDREVVVD